MNTFLHAITHQQPQQRRRAGFVFPTALLFMLIIGILLTGVTGYVSMGSRVMTEQIARTHCRLAAQTAIEDAKLAIYEGFREYYVRNRSKPPQVLLSWLSSNAQNLIKLHSSITPNEGCTLTYDTAVDNNNYISTRKLIMTVRVTAAKASAFGKTISRTLEETFSMAVEQSKVFDYAYFVNSFGVLHSGLINGNAYFNGDAVIGRQLSYYKSDFDCVINGTVSAAANERTGALGQFSLSDTSGGFAWPRMENLEEYRKRQEQNGFTRPTSPADDAREQVWPMGFSAGNTSSADAQRNEAASIFELPYLGDLTTYKELAQTSGGTLSYPELILRDEDIAGKVDAGPKGHVYYKQGARKSIKAVCSKKTPGPSGISGGADAGCVMMYGTKENPIRINGPVVIEGDVIIGGYITGQGCIYAGRNIHFVDNITYVNRPNWSNSPKAPVGTAEKNAKADLVGFCAKGLVTVGPANNPNGNAYMVGPAYWQWALSNQGDISYSVDESDASIGYPAGIFNGDYAQKDGAKRVDTIFIGEDGERKVTYADRHFYEPSVEPKYISYANLKMDTIDGVIFTNHAILGGTFSYTGLAVNGAYVVRNQGLFTMFGGSKFNWDIRLGSESRENLKNPIYLPMTIDRPRLIAWRELVPESKD